MTDGIGSAKDLARRRLALQRRLLLASVPDYFRYFWTPMTGLPYPDNVATNAMAAALQAVLEGRIWRLLIAMPPGVGKSTMTALFASMRFARRADWRGLHAMHAASDANRESLRVRRLVQSDVFRALFPEVVLREDEATMAAWATSRDGRYFAVGTDTAVTSKRVHELVVDDPMTAADRHSKAVRDRTWVWLEESAKTRLDGDRAAITIVAQRLDSDDLIGRCLESGEQWAYLALTAEREEGEPLELRAHDGSLVWRDERAVGDLLAPQMLSREKLAGLSSSVRRTQYFQQPSDDENALIKRTWWRWHAGPHVSPATPRPSGCDTDVPAVPTPKHFAQKVIGCDLTFGSTKGDYVAIQCWGASQSGRFLLARFRRRCGLLESVEAIKRMREDHPTARVIVERAANGAGAIEELKAAGVHGVIGVKPLGSKAERIGLVSATIESGDCYLPLGLPGIAEFVEELAGATKHDDEQDCAAYALHELNRTTTHHTELCGGWGGWYDPATGASGSSMPATGTARQVAPVGESGGDYLYPGAFNQRGSSASGLDEFPRRVVPANPYQARTK